MPSEPSQIKDYVSLRWDINAQGRLVVYQCSTDDEKEPSESLIPGTITKVIHKKSCALVMTGPLDLSAGKIFVVLFEEATRE